MKAGTPSPCLIRLIDNRQLGTDVKRATLQGGARADAGGEDTSLGKVL